MSYKDQLEKLCQDWLSYMMFKDNPIDRDRIEKDINKLVDESLSAIEDESIRSMPCSIEKFMRG